MRRIVSVSLALAMIGGLASSASAGQTDAGKDPSTRGPLVQGEESCERLVEHREEQVVAKIKLCSTFFSFKPSKETNGRRDFGVIWVQSNVDAEPGWCATRTETSGTLRRGRIHSAWPHRYYSPDSPKSVTARVIADANGAAIRKGSVKQPFTLYPERLFLLVSDSTHGGPVGIHARWKGSSENKLAFVAAAEISWGSKSDSPSFTPRVNYDIVEKETC